MATMVHCKVDSTEFSREQFRARLEWWTDRALDSENPTRWVESFDGGTQLRSRFRWDLYAEVGDEIANVATVSGPLPRLAFRRSSLTVDSSIPGFEALLVEALGTRRRDALRIITRRCTIESTLGDRFTGRFDQEPASAPPRILNPA